MTSESKLQLVCLQDYEEHASQILPPFVLDFYRGGADQEQTLRDNREAFKRWRLMPRVLRGVEHRLMATTALGYPMSAPIGIAPTAMQKMAHEMGELATAKAASDEGIVYVLSTVATSTIEEVSEAAPKGNNWFQLYIYKDRQVTVDMVRRAEQANFKALVVTVDTVILGRRLATERNELSNTGSSSSNNFVASLFDPSLTWKDISWLKSITKMPIVVKGILRPDDAELAVQHGVAAIAVSNHGGRQLDGVPATIDALPAIVKQVNGRCEVFVDGGITQGTDVFKALALGARMVFFGRPTLWGLAHSGEAGVVSIIRLLKKELDLAMALSGCSSVTDIDRSLVVHQSLFSNM
ncbi:hydroxyacid oxidase 1-like isoform X2 [Daphnia pulex]|uniref:hydroxyacid oxidase 1-like isoform X2 n=1 Tax=Daphnia pulex TaxID=6669 RepID=UPI001EDEEC54|nr:hydroxyacid oxidase 1-like isoform X2 [Daphnia pulex]